jgi:hypothetical protein
MSFSSLSLIYTSNGNKYSFIFYYRSPFPFVKLTVKDYELIFCKVICDLSNICKFLPELQIILSKCTGPIGPDGIGFPFSTEACIVARTISESDKMELKGVMNSWLIAFVNCS